MINEMLLSATESTSCSPLRLKCPPIDVFRLSYFNRIYSTVQEATGEANEASVDAMQALAAASEATTAAVAIMDAAPVPAEHHATLMPAIPAQPNAPSMGHAPTLAQGTRPSQSPQAPAGVRKASLGARGPPVTG